MKPYYEHGGITIYHGDCREVLPHVSADIAITSPPYNLGEGMEDKGGLRVGHAGSKWGATKLREGYGTHVDAMPYAQYIEWQKEVLALLWGRVSAIYYNHKPRIVKRSLRLPTALLPESVLLRQIIIWNRGSGFNFTSGAYVPRHEWILLLAKEAWELRDKSASGLGDVWDISPSSDAEHPCSFPQELPARAIETSGATSVIDPFAGVGTTLIAAKNFGRKAIGIEIEERYCEIAARRLEQEVLDLSTPEATK